MAEQQDRPDEGPDAAPAAKKAAAKKAPAKKAPAKKAPAKKAPAKKAVKKVPAKKAPAKKAPPPPALHPQPALAAGAVAPALTAGPNGAREAAAKAKSSVRDAVAPPSAHESFGRGHKIPLSLSLAAAGLVALVISRLRRG